MTDHYWPRVLCQCNSIFLLREAHNFLEPTNPEKVPGYCRDCTSDQPPFLGFPMSLAELPGRGDFEVRRQQERRSTGGSEGWSGSWKGGNPSGCKIVLLTTSSVSIKVIRILPAYTDGAVQIYFVISLSFISHLGLSYFCHSTSGLVIFLSFFLSFFVIGTLF